MQHLARQRATSVSPTVVVFVSGGAEPNTPRFAIAKHGNFAFRVYSFARSSCEKQEVEGDAIFNTATLAIQDRSLGCTKGPQ